MVTASCHRPGIEMAPTLLESLCIPVTVYRYPSGKDMLSVGSFLFELYLYYSVVEIAQLTGFRVGQLRSRHSIADRTQRFAAPSQHVPGAQGVMRGRCVVTSCCG